MKNIISVDVEEWFHPEALQHLFPPSEWAGNETRVIQNVDRLLALFRVHKVSATFFVLGWVAEQHPQLIEKIVQDGHEIGSHGYSHRMVTKMNEVEFQNDLRKSVQILEKISGRKVMGFRAPTFSIVYNTRWAWQILADNGFEYDSSVYPIIHDRYGMPDAPRSMYKPMGKDTDLLEFPMSTLSIGGKNMPFGGGGYLRILPLWFTKMAIKKINSENIPAIVYLHPWEFDKGQPVQPLGRVSRARHYYNIKNNLKKLDQLLMKYEFTSFKNYIDTLNE